MKTCTYICIHRHKRRHMSADISCACMYSICLHTHIRTNTHAYMRICTYLQIYVCIYEHIYTHLYIYIDICMYICIIMCNYVVSIYIYTHLLFTYLSIHYSPYLFISLPICGDLSFSGPSRQAKAQFTHCGPPLRTSAKSCEQTLLTSHLLPPRM